MAGSNGTASTALVPVKSRPPSLIALDIHRGAVSAVRKMARPGRDATPADRSVSHAQLTRTDTNGGDRTLDDAFFSDRSLIAGTAQLIALQSEANPTEAHIASALAGHDYSTAAALGARAFGTFVIAV